MDHPAEAAGTNDPRRTWPAFGWLVLLLGSCCLAAAPDGATTTSGPAKTGGGATATVASSSDGTAGTGGSGASGGQTAGAATTSGSGASTGEGATGAGSSSGGTGASTGGGSSGGTTGAPCDAGASCVAQGGCALGVIACGESGPTCQPTGSQPDGTVCHAGICCSGACVDLQADPGNCGGCGNVCPAGAVAPCQFGRCETYLAQAGGTVSGLAVEGADLYWSVGDHEGGVWTMPVDGGIVFWVDVTPWGPDPVAAMAVASHHVYEMTNGGLWEVPLLGGLVTDISAGGVAAPGNLAVSSSSVLWVSPGSGVYGEPFGISRWSPAFSVYPDPNGCGLAADSDSLYLGAGSSLLQVSIDAGTASTLASGQSFGGLCTLVEAAGSLYWIDEWDPGLGATLMTVTIDGGTPVALASGLENPTGLAVDESFAYFTEANMVLKVPLDGGAPVALGSFSSPPAPIAVDGTSVYCVMDGHIGKITPK